MKVHYGLAQAGSLRGGYVSIGNFDGVHRGHQSMIGTLTRLAMAGGAPSMVFTFDPHPIALLRPHETPPPLTTTERKLELLAEQGVEQVVVYPTDERLLTMSPRGFFDTIIVAQLAARGLVEGPNFCFGRDRQGTIDTLREFCGAAGVGLEIVDPVQWGDRPVSSTEIRRLIIAGDVAPAADLLGAPYRLEGTVARGAARGQSLGFPTANLERIATVIPRDGVYAGRCRVLGRWYPAAINVGPNPTFAEQARKFEAHLIDFSGDLYGAVLAVELVARLRDTQRFADIAALRTQLAHDVAHAKQLAGGPAAG